MSKRQDSWIQRNWRPMMSVAYMVIIVFDFVVAPVLWSALQAFVAGAVTVQWSPLTLISGGMFHAAMGAILGISAFTRGKEKIERLRSGYDETTPTDSTDPDAPL